MDRRFRRSVEKATDQRPLVTVEGWEDGQPYKRGLATLDRWELQSADRITVHVGKHDVALVQDPHSNHLGGYIWLTSIVFCSYLEALHSKPDRHSWVKLDWNRRWVELGSGVGLIGIMLRKLGVENVVITDIAELVPAMEQNVQASGLVVESIGGRRKSQTNEPGLLVEPLLWNDREAIERVCTIGEIDYVIACDCVYSETSAVDLVATMNQLASKNTTVICVCEVRNQAAQDRFLAEAQAFFKVDLIPASAWQKRAGPIPFEETLNMYRLQKNAA